ncbi:hypothetical protein MYP14_20870 [Rhodococcus pyridinivorans]|uniref:hypothetical protein n=1 Tax=Rhodococcus pyridinivorans TaxID=103816 RepID=UPI0020002D46|nr:hypothetical protein [Rhodococcus pyridinivorans]UPK63147.1 hypothetical protein MYP14_20870 [Rhodococcus pyridinivorans]
MVDKHRRKGVIALRAALAELPRYPHRPRCAGLAPLHDFEVPGETPTEQLARWRSAALICEGCPLMSTACTALAGTDLRGVVAGRVVGLFGQRGPVDPGDLEWCGERFTMHAVARRRRQRQSARRLAARRQATA